MTVQNERGPVELCWLDVETGGLEPATDALLEIACIRERAGELRYEVAKILPEPGLRVIPEALAKNRIDLSTWPGIAEHQALMRVRDLMDGAWAAGWHVAFDLAFLEAAWRRHPEAGGFPFRSSATRSSALALEGVALALGYRFANLDDLAGQLGVEVASYRRHTAMGDVELTRAVYRALLCRGAR